MHQACLYWQRAALIVKPHVVRLATVSPLFLIMKLRSFNVSVSETDTIGSTQADEVDSPNLTISSGINSIRKIWSYKALFHTLIYISLFPGLASTKLRSKSIAESSHRKRLASEGVLSPTLSSLRITLFLPGINTAIYSPSTQLHCT